MTDEPLTPRPAATVMLIRDKREGFAREIEVFLMRRHSAMDFVAGVMVFPGGGVDDRDRNADIAWFGPEPAWWAERFGVEPDLAQALVCAAARETFEESGVLLAGTSATDVVADTTSDDWEADRVALESRDLSMTDFLNQRGLVLRTDLLGAWDAWLTPAFEPRRYRTWFFVASLPAGQVTRDVSTESSSVAWLPARVAADQADAGELAMMPPTYLTSMEVGALSSPDEVLSVAASRSVEMFTPSIEPLGSGWTLSVPERLRPLIASRRHA